MRGSGLFVRAQANPYYPAVDNLLSAPTWPVWTVAEGTPVFCSMAFTPTRS
jgi:hypothetical protein